MGMGMDTCEQQLQWTKQPVGRNSQPASFSLASFLSRSVSRNRQETSKGLHACCESDKGREGGPR